MFWRSTAILGEDGMAVHRRNMQEGKLYLYILRALYVQILSFFSNKRAADIKNYVFRIIFMCTLLPISLQGHK